MLENARMTRLLGTGLVLGATAFLGACDDDDGILTDDDEVRYAAVLTELNNSGVAGTAEFVMDDGVLTASVEAIGLDAVVHPQHIHASGACPTMAMDRADDGDSFLDVLEASPAYGPILLPLDTDLVNRSEGSFPQGTTIDYLQTANRDALLQSLRSFESDNAAMTGLESGETLDLATRTVVLHGVAGELPASVQSIGDLPATTTLPVACGVLVRVD